ncbi:hypothetical protein [Arthrobacter terrae]|nr:hypothetical protein [Arthrobacter terrae]
MGEGKSFGPADAVTGLTKDEVHINQTREPEPQPGPAPTGLGPGRSP